MSAIAGIFFFDGAPVEHGLIEKLTAAMKSRGPDEQTHWVKGSIALGHCMLRTTPESLEEHQPLMSQDKSLVLVWDGRLDNREQLRRDLISAGTTMRDNSDAELALHSYAVWGEECPERLLGDFAFAVWDVRRNKLFCARDHMGARPFYYTSNSLFFAFSSEDEALLELPGVSNNLNEDLIAYFLVPAFQSFDPARSWLEDVASLLPAQSVAVAPNRTLHKDTYWYPEPMGEIKYGSDEECEEAFLGVFGEAVRCRMRSIGNVSAMISGGLDSAGIAAMVRRLLPEVPGKQFHTYSAISDNPQTCVESQCVLSVTKAFGDKAHFLSVPSLTGMLSAQDLIDIAWTKPHPVDNSILLPAMMCLAASRDGQRVMLHGASGDLIMNVPGRYVAYLLVSGEWRQAWKECLAASRNNTYLRGVSPFVLLILNLYTAYIPAGIRSFVRSLHTKPPKYLLRKSLINSGFADRLKLAERMWEAERKAVGPLEDLQQAYASSLMPPSGIASGLTGCDRVAGHYGIEPRDPWGDKRVVEFFQSLPLKYKVRQGWTKYILRKAFESDLSPDVRFRIGKEHLGWDFVIRLMDESQDLLSKTVCQDLVLAKPYVNENAIRELYDKYCATRSDIDRQSLYDTMTLILWMRRTAF